MDFGARSLWRIPPGQFASEAIHEIRNHSRKTTNRSWSLHMESRKFSHTGKGPTIYGISIVMNTMSIRYYYYCYSYYCQGLGLKAVCVSVCVCDLILTIALWRKSHCWHYTEDDAEIQRCYMVWLRSCSWYMTDSGFDPWIWSPWSVDDTRLPHQNRVHILAVWLWKTERSWVSISPSMCVDNINLLHRIPGTCARTSFHIPPITTSGISWQCLPFLFS